MTTVFFNLLANSTFSLICGLLVVSFFIWMFRVGTDRSRLFLLTLPFVKIIYDIARGVPHASILYSGVDPFTLPGGNQTFAIGAGFSKWSLFLNAVFTVKDTVGNYYPASAGDYLLNLTQRELGGKAPFIIVSCIFAISALLIIRRAVQGIRFERGRQIDRKSSEQIQVLVVGWRTVDVYKSAKHSGTPFTGGILRPYICIPADADRKLSPEEQTAVIAHELGHIGSYDLIATMATQLMGDLFWFVPGYRWLSRRIDRLREILADQSAIYHGSNPAHLAAALIKLKEIPEGNQKPILYSAFFRERSLLKERIERLTGLRQDLAPRMGWQNNWLRAAVCLFAIGSVINSTFGGNHETMHFDPPTWLMNLMHSLGF